MARLATVSFDGARLRVDLPGVALAGLQGLLDLRTIQGIRLVLVVGRRGEDHPPDPTFRVHEGATRVPRDNRGTKNVDQPIHAVAGVDVVADRVGMAADARDGN